MLGRREFLVKIRQKFYHFLRGHSSPLGRNSKKMKKTPGGLFVLNAEKNLCDILTRATPSKTPCTGTTPKNFLKQSRIFRGAHVGARLVVFGNKVATKGTPKEKINLAPPTPKWGETKPEVEIWRDGK